MPLQHSNGIYPILYIGYIRDSDEIFVVENSFFDLEWFGRLAFLHPVCSTECAVMHAARNDSSPMCGTDFYSSQVVRHIMLTSCATRLLNALATFQWHISYIIYRLYHAAAASTNTAWPRIYRPHQSQHVGVPWSREQSGDIGRADRS